MLHAWYCSSGTAQSQAQGRGLAAWRAAARRTCTTVRGKPSSTKPVRHSGLLMFSSISPTTISSDTSAPAGGPWVQASQATARRVSPLTLLMRQGLGSTRGAGCASVRPRNTAPFLLPFSHYPLLAGRLPSSTTHLPPSPSWPPDPAASLLPPPPAACRQWPGGTGSYRS